MRATINLKSLQYYDKLAYNSISIPSNPYLIELSFDIEDSDGYFHTLHIRFDRKSFNYSFLYAMDIDNPSDSQFEKYDIENKENIPQLICTTNPAYDAVRSHKYCGFYTRDDMIHDYKFIRNSFSNFIENMFRLSLSNVVKSKFDNSSIAISKLYGITTYFLKNKSSSVADMICLGIYLGVLYQLFGIQAFIHCEDINKLYKDFYNNGFGPIIKEDW